MIAIDTAELDKFITFVYATQCNPFRKCGAYITCDATRPLNDFTGGKFIRSHAASS